MAEVAVIIPCYGHARFLPEAVESVRAQEHGAWECVIVDDGSPDETAAVAGRLVSSDPAGRIRFVQRPNGGVAAARNTGIRATSAGVVVPLDADDRLAPGYLARVLDALSAAPGAGIAFTDLRLFGESDEVCPYGPFEPGDLLRTNVLPVTSAFRRSLWERAGGYADEMRDGYEDWHFWLSCQEAGAVAVHVPGPLFHYRAGGGGLLARAQAQDTRLKARLIAGHPRSFSPVQQEWAQRLLSPGADDAPAHQGRSFAPLSTLPSDGEALADLGVLAADAGDDEAAAALWLRALRGPDLTSPQRSSLYKLAAALGLDGALRARAALEP
jgi:glycosyltransferase involved in cell wall biosynthesis